MTSQMAVKGELLNTFLYIWSGQYRQKRQKICVAYTVFSSF